MCRKILWCYVFVLTLLDLSLKTKLTAQGKSHGVTIQDSLREGIPYQEWDKEAWGEGVGSIEAEDEGEAIEGVVLEPQMLKFGRAALAEPHSRTVTVINTANSTLHLASVAGTTPDFHSSFFESKTLAPQGNTTFTVVYLGRREGPVSARLYIHTSLGVRKYAVSAVGVSSEYEVWPLVGVRVPLNATVEWELRLHNPTETTVQVTEVYSTGSWLVLSLPEGGASAPVERWAVPPRRTRTLVRLRIAPAPGVQQSLTAYVRVRANMPGGGLILPVEARSVPPGEYARPLHVRLRARGASDPPYTVEVEMANSGPTPVTLEGGVRGACRATPATDPCELPPRRVNGASASGAQLTLLRSQLDPHQDFTRVARLTLDYGQLWAGGTESEAAEGMWCAGCVRVGGAALPYSVRVLPGALLFQPPHLHFVTSEGIDTLQAREVVAHNEFQLPVRVEALQLPHGLDDYFRVEDLTPVTISPGGTAAILRVLPTEACSDDRLVLDKQITVLTNLSHYHLPLRLYSGKLNFEWEWGNKSNGVVQLGTLGTSTTRRVGVRLHNPAPLPVCVTRATATLPGAAAALALPTPLPCVDSGMWTQAWLTVVAPAREGHLHGELTLRTEYAQMQHALEVRVRAGRLRALPLRLPPYAPYTSSWAELVINNSMSVRMRVVDVSQAAPDPALVYTPFHSEVEAGSVVALGRVSYEPERACAPSCYTGLGLDDTKGQEWLKRGWPYDERALRADLALLRERLALYERSAAAHANVTLHLRTDEVAQTTVSGSVRAHWPRLVASGAGRAGLSGVHSAMPVRLTLRNAATVPLLLRALLAPSAPAEPLPQAAGGELSCPSEHCRWSRAAFNLTGWRVTSGAARLWPDGGTEVAEGRAEEGGGSLPSLLLSPRAELELALVFEPHEAAPLTAHLYLRNNLTILEGVQLFGQGEYPSFDIAGRRPGSPTPFLFEVKECSKGNAVERRVVVRNTGEVPVRLSQWTVGGAACVSRGFRVRPCGAVVVAPGASAHLHLAFAPDYTLARVVAPLRAQTPLGLVEYTLMATVPARLLSECVAPRPPWDGMMRGLSVVLAFATLALILAAAALDAERLLRRARAARAPSPPRAPLDLRTFAAPTPQPVPRASRKRKPSRRTLPALDPQAERRAFERWRTEVLRRDDESSRSSEDDHQQTVPCAPPAPPPEDEPSAESRTPTPPAEHDDGAARLPDTDVTSGSDASNISNASTPVDEQDTEDCYAGDAELDTRDDSPADGLVDVVPEPKIMKENSPKTTRTRVRRETDLARRERSKTTEGVERRSLVRPHARKERCKRVRERMQPSPPAPAAAEGTEVESRGVRWGTSWSSVVAGAPPLPPIGSDVRRRETERGDQSLFYFNGGAEQRPDGFAWQPPLAVEPQRQPFLAPPRDYIEDCGRLGTTGMSSGWWGGGWSAWGSTGPLRPPPGFASPPPPQRPFDPFRSLASIWAPAPHDWRLADDPAPSPSAPGTPLARGSPNDELK